MPLLKTPLFLLTFVFSQLLFSQNSPNWTLTNTNGLVSHIYDILFVSDQQGYLIGENKVLETFDGGDSWNFKLIQNDADYLSNLIRLEDSIFIQFADTNNNHFEISFLANDTNNVFLVKSKNFQYGSIAYPKRTYSFANAIWTLVNDTLFQYKNQMKTALKTNIQSLAINDGLISAVSTDYSQFYYSSDTAQSWNSISLIDTNWNLSIMAGCQQIQSYYTGGDTIFVIGRTYPSYDYVSYDNGISWNYLSVAPHYGRKPMVYHFYSKRNIIGSFNGVVLISTDGGFNFSPDTVDHNMPYSKMYVYNDSLAFLYGRNGKVYKSVNAGGLTGVKPDKGETQFQLFPNPASDNLHLNLELNRTLKHLTLFDVQGKLIKRFNPAQRVLDISEVPNGLYFLNLNFEKESYSQKVIINH